ncbi:MAG: MarR family transcriptional regulator [Eubacteriales bacterium]|nr:MarR family transcriptional regulator [Eubacteriales bacterium]
MDGMDLFRQLIRIRECYHRLDFGGLHPGVGNGEFAVMELVYRHSRQHGSIFGAYVSELLRTTNASPPALSRVLRMLEKKGLCVRQADPQDRRSTCVYLTEDGLRLREESSGAMRRFAKSVIGSMGEEELTELIRLMVRLEEVLQTELREYQKGD